jgi:hypothetical protein
MAHAGFVFTPAEAGDDTGACLYCHVALGNWDEDDDPMYVQTILALLRFQYIPIQATSSGSKQSVGPLPFPCTRLRFRASTIQTTVKTTQDHEARHKGQATDPYRRCIAYKNIRWLRRRRSRTLSGNWCQNPAEDCVDFYCQNPANHDPECF